MLHPFPSWYDCDDCGHRQTYAGGMVYLLLTRTCKSCGSTNVRVVEDAIYNWP